MSERTSYQRFFGELRRRHVGRTVAVYLVAAWAAIQFADVVVPNLNGPQWIVTAVIVAAGVGLPVVLVLAWIFDWGPDGIHRTHGETAEPGVREDVGITGTPIPPRTAGAPWMAAVAVLIVAIASGVAVAALIEGTSEDEPGASRPGADAVPSAPEPPELVGPAGDMDVDAIRSRVLRGLEQVESLGDLERLGDLEALGRRVPGGSDLGELMKHAARGADRHVFLESPEEWVVGRRDPVALAEGDTLMVQGLVRDTAGVVSVSVDGAPAAQSDGSGRTLRFTGRVVGTGHTGTRRVVITVQTADGRELRSEYPVRQVPSSGNESGGP
jgi:hypothetical protein